MTNQMKASLARGLISLALLAPIYCFAVNVKVVFGTEAPRSVWVLPKLPEQLPENGREFTAKQFEIEIPDSLIAGVVVVGEQDTGNFAFKRCQEIINKGVWNVRPEDMVAGRVSVSVSKDSEPADGVMVTMTRGQHQKSTMSIEGEADFFFVSFGDVEISASYNNGKELVNVPPKTLRVTLAREEVVPTEVISLPADAVLKTKPTPAEEKKAAEKTTKPGWFSGVNLIYYLLALIIAGSAAWYLFKQAKQNDTKIVQQLRNLGVDPVTTDPADAQPASSSPVPKLDETPLVPAGHCLFCGEKFDADGTCSCSRKKAAAAVAAPASTPLTFGVKKAVLVSESGGELPIAPGVCVVGREGDVHIEEPTVSRRHAEFNFVDGRLTLKDLGSANGTYVNGVKIEQETEMKHGDAVQFGGYKMRVTLS